MQTLLLNSDSIEKAAFIINQGGLVVFPTETVYGLGADVFNPEAVKKIFLAKGRPQDNPLIAHIYDKSQVQLLARELPRGTEILMEAFWPGPLTIVLPKNSFVPDIVSAGLDTVGVRLPSHKTALAFLKACNTPIAAPSANISTKPSPTNFSMARKAMEGRVEAIIDGGESDKGLESTVVAWTETNEYCGWTILRPGAVTREDLFSVLDTLFVQNQHTKDEKLLARSPGTRHPHYRPQAEVLLFAYSNDLERGAELLTKNWAIIGLDSEQNLAQKATITRLYPNWIDLARRLYADFSELDSLCVPGILVQAPTETTGIAEALLNRLLKASQEKWL